MTKMVTVYDKNGKSHRMTEINAVDVVRGGNGWSFGGKSSQASGEDALPAELHLVNEDGEVQKHSAENARDLMKSGWRRATKEEIAAAAADDDDDENSQNSPADSQIELPPEGANRNELKAYAEKHGLTLDYRKSNVDGRLELIEELKAKTAQGGTSSNQE